jgi:ABC-type branched-subunit amino acid transport system substrate-binding protein
MRLARLLVSGGSRCGGVPGRRWRAMTTAVGAVALVAALLSACGSSKSTSTATTVSPTTTSSTASPSAATSPSTSSSSSLPASGPGTGSGTVTVGVQCANTGEAAEPECLTTFHALAAYANSNGGINGYKISIDDCDISNAQATPTVTGTCADKQITEDHDMVLVGLNGGLGVTPVADANSVPIISPIDVESDFDTAPMSFPVYAWNTGGWTAIAQYMVKIGLTHPAYTNPQSELGAETIGAVSAAYKALNIPLKQVNASLTAVSFQPQVEALKAEGVDSVFPVLADPAIIAMVQESAAIDYHPAWASIWDSYDQRVEKTLAPLSSSNNLYLSAPFKPYETAGQLESSTVAKYAPGQSWEFSFISINDWIGMEILFQALEHMSGPASSQKILGQLNTRSFTSEWLPAPVSWTNTTGPLCRLASADTYFYKLESGKWTYVSGPTPTANVPAVTGCKS